MRGERERGRPASAARRAPAESTAAEGGRSAIFFRYTLYAQLKSELPFAPKEGYRLPGFTRFYWFNLLPNHTRFNLAPTNKALLLAGFRTL